MNLLKLIWADPELRFEVAEVVQDPVAEAIDVRFPLQKQLAQKFAQGTPLVFFLVRCHVLLVVLLVS